MNWRDESASTRPVAGVLDDGERRDIQARFGVTSDQVTRDHIISHALAAIATVGIDRVVFFGGTALSRTHLTDVRLSEDIDLIAIGDRHAVGDRIETAITSGLQRTLGAATFVPRLRDTRHPQPAVMQVGDTRIQIQLLSERGYPTWPTEVVAIEQRYSDAAPAELRVLTPAAFVASKLSAWSDRQAPRDLYDLWAMGQKGMIDRAAVDLFARVGHSTSASRVLFTNLPTEDDWLVALGHQGIVRIGPRAAAASVRDAIQSALER